MKFRVNIGSGITINTDSGSAGGDSSGCRQFGRSFPDFKDMDLDDLKQKISAKGWSLSAWVDVTDQEAPQQETKKVEESEPEDSKPDKSKPVSKKKKGIFSKSDDGEKKDGD